MKEQRKINIIPYYSISPNRITTYELPETIIHKNKKLKSFENLRDNKNYLGELSPHAKKRLHKKIDYMIYLTKEKLLKGRKINHKYQNYTTELIKKQIHKNKINYKLTFITLTLPSKQIHTDNEIKSKCLNQFLIEIKKKYKANQYIWKAEKQQNGNIHFHILTNKYIFHTKIKSTWNRIINKLGYVDRYKHNMKQYFKNGFILSNNKFDKRSREQQNKSYQYGLKTNWESPNSTDIHAIHKIKNLNAYLSKYLCKDVTKTNRTLQMKKLKNEIIEIESKINEENIKENTNKIKNLKATLEKLAEKGIKGRIWGCSQLLSRCKNLVFEGYAELLKEFAIIKKNSYLYT